MNRYFGEFNPTRGERWVFGSRETGHYLRKFAWTKIVRHQVVTGTASPDDPSLAEYWAKRQRSAQPTIGRAERNLLRIQHGRCPLCRGLLLHAEHEPQSPQEWEQWLKGTQKAIRQQAVAAIPGVDATDEHVAMRLIHTHCRRRIRKGDSGTAVLLARMP